MRVRRMLRHWHASLRPARKLMPASALAQIEHEIEQAERTHSGEIRVAVETALPLSLLWRKVGARERALQLFASLGVWDTRHNNGVLIYVLLGDRAVEIIADRGIAEHIPASEWQALAMRSASVSARAIHGRVLRRGAERQAPDALLPAGDDGGNELPNQPILL
jgi:uncharacterized membrane protein